MNHDAKLFGQGLLGPRTPPPKGPLRAEFGAPPFSVLDAREGSWQTRKQKWLALGIESHVGRAEDLQGFRGGTGLKRDGTPLKASASLGEKDTSVFDPVLCELLYRWFCPPGGVIVDPFAGGSVRGIVASAMGYRYWGCDLRKEQVDANIQQATRERCGQYKPKWVVGDAAIALGTSPDADFVFSCPPYGNLEVYSNDAKDLSNMTWPNFCEAYQRIVYKAAMRLKQNRFASFVVGNFREDGLINDLVSLTNDAFKAAGCRLYNEAILVTAVGTASMRGRRIFNGARKLCKTHQNVQVYVKGDPQIASDNIGATDV